MTKINYFFIFLILIGITACGGGGSKSSTSLTSFASITSNADASYTGLRDKAFLNKNNSMVYVNTLLGGGSNSELINTSPESSSRSLNPLQAQRSLSNSINQKLISPNQSDSYQARTINEVEYCSQSGVVIAKGDLNNAGIGSLILQMNNCTEDGLTINGKILMNITKSESDRPMAYQIGFDDVTMSYNGQTYNVIGTQTYEQNVNYETTIVSNILQTGEDGNQIYSKDLTVKNQNYSGKIYLEEYGYVDISSPAGPVSIDSYSNNFIYSGELLLSGASSSKVLLSPKYNQTTYSRELRVDLDENGDGIYEFLSIQYETTDLNNPNEFLENNPPLNNVNVVVNYTEQESDLNNLRVNDNIEIEFYATDPEGYSVDYTWTIESSPTGSNIEFNGPSTSSILNDEIMHLKPDLLGSYSISIKATDADGFSSISFVNFTVLENLIPIAVITDDVISAGDFNHLGHRVRLSSEKSSDPENSYLRKSWKLESKPSNSTIDISGDDYNDSLWFWPDVSGTYLVSLIVTDDQNTESNKTYMTIEIPENFSPVADFRLWRSSNGNTVGSKIEFESMSEDVESTSLDNEWKLVSKPQGSLITLPAYSLTSYYTNITPDLPGVYSLQLTVTDPDGSSDSKTHSFTITNW